MTMHISGIDLLGVASWVLAVDSVDALTRGDFQLSLTSSPVRLTVDCTDS
jgi:hypothetical protein